MSEAILIAVIAAFLLVAAYRLRHDPHRADRRRARRDRPF